MRINLNNVRRQGDIMTVKRMDNVGKVAQYEDTYRLCYIRGPEGILIGLAQELG